MYRSWDNALHKGLSVLSSGSVKRQHSPLAAPLPWCPWQRGFHALLERWQPSWGLSPPTGPTFQLKPHCLASPWFTAPATFHLHHGFCSSMPIFHNHLKSDPSREDLMPGAGAAPGPQGCLLLVGGGTDSACPQGAPTVPTPWSSQHLTF